MSDMNSARGAGDSWQDKLDDWLPGGRTVSLVFTVIGIYLLVCVVLGMYWSIAPEPFDVRERAAVYAGRGRSGSGHRLGHHRGPDGRDGYPADEAGRVHPQRYFPPGGLAGQHAQLGIRRADPVPRPGAGPARSVQSLPVPVHRGCRPGDGGTALQFRFGQLGPAGLRVGVPRRHQVCAPVFRPPVG